MTYEDLEEGVRYVVVQDSTCTSLKAGDKIYLSSQGGFLCNSTAGGFIPPEGLKELGTFEASVDRDHYRNKAAEFIGQIKHTMEHTPDECKHFLKNSLKELKYEL
jgi:hypothetical protein